MIYFDILNFWQIQKPFISLNFKKIERKDIYLFLHKDSNILCKTLNF